MKDVRIEQGSERRETEGQLLSSFTAIMLISPLFFFSPQNLYMFLIKPHEENVVFFFLILFSAGDAACLDLCAARGWPTLCKGRRYTEMQKGV